MTISEFPKGFYKTLRPDITDVDTLTSYKLGLTYVQKVVFKDPNAFFRDLDRIENEFLDTHLMMCVHEPEIFPGDLRKESIAICREIPGEKVQMSLS